MSNKKLAILGIIAVLMTGLAVLQSRISQRANVADFSSSALIEGLQIDAVAGISITSGKGKRTTTLNRTGGVFVIADKDDYPADAASVNDLFNGCLDIRVQEKITANPANHAELGVTPETARAVVSFLDKDGNPVVAVAISKNNEKGAAFVRLLSEDAVYSVQYPPQIETDPKDFVDAQLLQLSQDQLASVAVRTGEDSYVLTVTDDGSDIELRDMPAGKQYKGTAYKTVFGAMRSLRFDDVMSAESAPEALDFDSVYTCKLKDQTVYKLMMKEKGGNIYAKISARYTGQTPKKKQEVESEEALKEKEAILLVIDAVNRFNQKHNNWVYQIPAASAGNLMTPLSELLEDIPEPVSETEPNAVP